MRKIKVLSIFLFVLVLSLGFFQSDASEKSKFIERAIQNETDLATTSFDENGAGVFVTLTSEGVPFNQFLNSSKKVVVVCDSEYTVKDVFSCSSSGIEDTLAGDTDTVAFQDEADFLYIYEYKSVGPNVVVINEMGFLSPSNREKVGEYLERFESVTSESVSNDQGQKNLELHISEGASFVFELAFYLTFILLLALFLRRLFISITRGTLGGDFGNLVQRFHSSLLVLEPYFLILLAFSITAFISLVVYKSSLLPFSEVSEDVVSTLIPMNIVSVLRLSSRLDLGLLINFYISLIAISFVGLVELIGLFRAKEIKGPVGIRYSSSVSVVIIFITLTALLFDNSEIVVTMFLFLTMCFVALSKITHNTNLSFSKKFGILVVFLFLSSVVVIKSSNSSSDDVVVEKKLPSREFLPLVVPNSPTQIYKSYEPKGNDPIIVGGYLVYHPDYKLISNKSLREFTSVRTKDSIVFVSNKDEAVKVYLMNENLRNIMSAEAMSEIFYVNGLEELKKGDTYEAELTFNCSTNPKPHNVRFQKYKYNGEPFGRVEVFNFPGCSKPEVDNSLLISYRLPLEIANLDTPIFSFYDFNDLILEEFQIFNDGRSIPINYISDSHIFISDKGSDEVDFYSVAIDKNLAVENSKTFDLAEAVNLLNGMGRLGDAFVITSFNPTGVFLRYD